MPGKRSRPVESKISVDGASCAVFNNFCVFLGLSSPKRPTYSEGPEAVGLGILAALHENNNGISKGRVVSSKNLEYRISAPDNVKICRPYADERHRHDYKKIKDDGSLDCNDSMPSLSIDVNGGFLPTEDFLYACCLCRRRLSPKKDIYMYRGDKAFCSQECRYLQIVSDAEKERRVSAASAHSCNSFSSSSSSIFTCVS